LILINLIPTLTTIDDDMYKNEIIEKRKVLIDKSFNPDLPNEDKLLARSRSGNVYKIKIGNQNYVVKMTKPDLKNDIYTIQE